jgi:hypothetical protein
VHTPHSRIVAAPRAAADGAHENTFPAIALLLLLLCADAGFTLLHLISVETGWLRATGISLEADGGPAEIFQYVKEFWIIVCMAAAFAATRRAVYAGWACVFVFLLVDDAGKVHEQVGAWLGQRYGFAAPFGLRPDDIGELLFAGAVGIATLAIVGPAVWRGTEQCRRISRDVFALIVVLAFFGVVADVLHVIAYFGESLLAQVLLVVEDGGEMIVMSALTAYAFHVGSHVGRTRLDLWSIVTTPRLWGFGQLLSPGPATLKDDAPRAGSWQHEWPDESSDRRSA